MNWGGNRNQSGLKGAAAQRLKAAEELKSKKKTPPEKKTKKKEGDEKLNPKTRRESFAQQAEQRRQQAAGKKRLLDKDWNETASANGIQPGRDPAQGVMGVHHIHRWGDGHAPHPSMG